MPRPVTTTRFIARSLVASTGQAGRLLEKPDPEVGGLVYGLAVGLQPAVADAEHQPAAHDALEVDAVLDLLVRRRHHARELHLAGRQRAALAGLAQPAEEEAAHLPQRVEAEAAGHDRVADEMAGEEPEVAVDVEFGADIALVELAAALADLGDAVEHQHRRIGQLGVSGAEQLTAGAGQQILIGVAGLLFLHYPLSLSRRALDMRLLFAVLVSQSVSPRKRLLALSFAPICRGQCAAIDRFHATEYISALGKPAWHGRFGREARTRSAAKLDGETLQR